jgi:hypothetical protein
VARYPHTTSSYIYLWNFFNFNHGKHPHDEARVVLKYFIKQAQLDMQGNELQNAKQVVALL